MNEKDPIKDLFQDALRNIEVPVKPQVWQAVSQSMAATTTSAATGMSLLTKIIIGIASAGLITSGIVYFSGENASEEIKTQTTEDTKEISQEEETKVVSEEANKTIAAESNVKQNFTTEKQAPQVEMPLSEMTTHPISETSIAPASSLPMITTPKTAPIQTITNVETKHQAQVIKQSKVSEPTSVPQESELNFVLPNVFTPNGDGANDFFQLQSHMGLTDFTFAITNRWGNTIAVFTSPDFQWDGGNQTEGVYFYRVTATGNDGQEYDLHGFFQLVRD
jgi:gliding motility-associated-like protein